MTPEITDVSPSNPYGPPWVSAESYWVPTHVAASGWLEHAPFASWLIANVRPKRVVELGTHNGYSYFTFCEAVLRLAVPAELFAVDTWQGDDHAGFYGEDIFGLVSRINEEKYKGFSTLLRGRFDEHVNSFPDGGIDLLHIDGRHGLEDVTEDFDSWLPKLAANAIVLFHDTAVHERDFGVWQLWEQLEERYANTFEFAHGNGLGVLAVGSVPSALRPFFGVDTEQVALIRDFYAERGKCISNQYWQQEALRGQAHRVDELVQAIDQLRAQLRGQQNQYEELLNSTSWKVTKPLRSIVDKVRKSGS